ncbi:MAG: 3-phosphoshikimate 1-carboxyvinyltransferase [Parcubacteria group bacterium Gr01-1014_8]|nr:MAG: 3-phosphoshikimate 1-carboxyvinyltransferase [Parcubacteria group bacterium Gr01-1014_8]
MISVQLQPLTGPANTSVDIPGSKSYTNRALLMATMCREAVRILKPLVSDDTRAMLNCLKTLGIKVEEKSDEITVIGHITDVKNQDYELDADLSGTTIRFMLALSCVLPGVQTLVGKEGLNKRPIKDLVDGLRQLGAKIEYLEKEGFPPLRVSSYELNPGTIRLKGGVSSQFLSAILMIVPQVGDVTLEVEGEQISKPYIDMTIDTMSRFGVSVANLNYQRYRVSVGQVYQGTEYTVEGDVSSASYFAAIAALTKSRITLANMNPQSVQADMHFFHILEDMGASVSYEKDRIVVVGNGVMPMEVDMENCPDQAQTMAVLSAFAPGVTKLSGVRSLRLKETERVKALEAELAKMGIKTESTEDMLTIYGGSPKAAAIDTYGDHRMAMSFAVAGAMLDGMQINDFGVVGKTFPQFWEKLESIGVGVKRV